MKAIGQVTTFTLDYTDSADKTYYVTSTNELATSANNTPESGTQAYKFYVSETSNPTSGTKYDHFYKVHVNNADATVTFIFQTTKPVGFSNGPYENENAFKVTKGTLILKLDEEHYTSDTTLRRVGNFTTNNNNNNKNSPFYLINDAGAASHQRLIIEGLDPEPEDLLYPVSNVKQDTATYLPGRQFVIDGAANITSVNMTTGDPTYTGIDTNKKPLFRVETGTLHLTNVTIQNSINSSTDATHGGIFLMLNDNASQNNRNLDVILTHCWLHNLVSTNYKTGYPGIGLQWQMRKTYGSGSVVLKRSKFTSISNNSGQEAAIRSTTGCKASVTIDSCNINNNFGGGIRWQGLVADPMQVKNTTIKGNYTKKSGGGIMAKSPLVLTACKILNNTAYMHGGGINYMCYDESGMKSSEAGIIYPKNLELTMDAATIIDGNKTETGNGGGIMVWGRLINLTQTGQMGYVYHEYDQNGNVVGPYQMKVNLNGATIQNNTAYNNGGGIFIYREAGTGTDPVSGEVVRDASCYLIDCKLSYGNIKGNKALNGSGGGVCIYQTGTPNPAHVNADHPAQDIGVYTGGGSNNLTIAENKAEENGGGLYLYAVTDGSGWTAVQKFNTKIELNDHTFIQKDSTSNGFGGGVYLHQGNITMNNATIGGSAADLGNYTGSSGGGIYVHSGTVTMLSTLIQHNKANSGSGGGLYVGGGDVFINPNEIGAGIRSKISNNTAGQDGGGVYTAAGKLTAYGSFSESGAQSNHIEIINNKALGGNGGGIYCRGTLTSQSWEYDIRLRRVDIGNNYAKYSGGGVYLYEGRISVTDGAINGNTADENGGGVYTENGNIDINATRDERFASEIMGNTAGINGGGLNTHKGYIRIFGTSKDQRIPIANNKANTGSGGGIFCMGEGADNQYITLQHADLINNKAVNGEGDAGTDVVAGCGGGMYLQKGKIAITDVNIQNNYAINNGGGINNHEGSIDVNGCFIGSSHSDGGEYYYEDELTYSTDPNETNDTDRGNEAGNNGGGIYTHKGDIDIEDYVETSGNIFREESKITFNKAGNNGGGVNTHMGTISINTKEEDDQIEVAFNLANKGGGMYANAGTIIAHNALIHDNTATLNGGGANNHSGDIRFYGGSLSNNTAEKGHGGGAYTNVGDIDLFQFPSTNLMNLTLNDGMKVFNNIAKINGGAFNNHTGRVDVRHATLYNNTATNGNGGAIFCEGPHANSDKGLGYTIRLLYSDMVQNKTRGQDGTATDPTGRGGGIYLKYGSIFAHYSNILNNNANINGGGIDNHSGNILLYGCNVQENQAVTGNGGGIFTYAGDITIGPSTARDGISTTSKPTIITLNTAKQDGGGINNQQGNITINGDIVANNEALEGNGGGVYIADGIIDMNGGRIDYNKADNGQGGGVWSGGGEFNIKDRNATPDPIVLIVDSEVKRGTSGQTATIHYHLIDQGKYVDVTNVEHGIIWGENSPNTEVVFNPSSDCCKQGEPACQRITIPNVTPDKTYKVKAFFRYKTIENGTPVVKTGYSETMEFVTYSSKPLVLSGTVSNITSTSAEGSGKILDPGDSPIISNGRGVQIWTGSSTPPPSLTVDNKRPSQDETDFFTVDLRKKEGDTYVDLNPNTTYYARAYATNNQGTSYGNTVEFKTLKNTPDMGNNRVIVTTGIVNGEIVATAEFSMPTGTTFGGTNGVKAFGFVWSTDDDPELLQDHTVQGTLTSAESTTFTASYSPVRPNLTFYVRAYASYNETSVTPTSDITNFSVSEPTQHISPSLDGSPVVRATSISGITQNQATINCEIYSGYVSGTTTTKYGVYVDNLVNNNVPENDPDYGTHRFPSSNFVPQSTTPPNNDKGTYSVTLTGLTPGTTYYLKAYATNDGTNYSYGNDYNFTALPISRPNVMVTAINYHFDPDDPEQTDHSMVDVVCKIVSDGGAGITACGINYGDFQLNAQNQLVPVPAEHSPIQGNVSSITNGEFTITIMNLTPHKDYWVNAYVTNEANLTHTCQSVNFTSNYDKPSVELDNINNLVSVEGTETNPPTLTGTGNYTVTLAGTTPVRTHGVCWSTFHNPKRTHSDVANTHFQDGTGPINESGSSSATMNQRFPNMKYYARAYASTETPNDAIDPNNPANNTYALADIVYCEQERAFLTLPLMQSNGVSNINSTSATLAGTIASRDPEHYLIKYGVCWGMNANPTPIKDPTDPNYDSEHPNYLEVDITSASSTTRPFSFNVTGLTPYNPSAPQTYHYRAYAINRNGKEGTDFAFALDSIAYGPDVEFQTTPYTITATANPASAGSVAYTSGLTSGGGWDGNSSFTLTAQANENWQFKDWTRNGETTTLTGNPLTQISSEDNPDEYDVVPGNHTYLANFMARVSVAANGTGSVGITGQEGTEAYFDLNTSVTVTATPTPESSASFLYWTDAAGAIIMGDDGEPLVEDTYTFDLSAPVSLTAHFSIRTISVSAIPAEGGTVTTVTGGDTFSNNAPCTVSATANEGYVFLYWKEGDNVVSTDAEYTFFVSSDRTLTAYFGRTIAVSANNNGSVSGGGNYPVGAECTVTATPAEGYVFLNWKENNVVVVDGENNPVTATYTFTVSGNRTLEANFEPSRSSGASRPSRPRDIYPAPAREPWDWADDLRDGEPTVPTVTTGAVTFSVDMQVINAIVSGNIVTELGAEGEDATLIEAGIWYCTNGNPYHATDNQGAFLQAFAPVVGEAYSVAFPELTIGQTYYARAYAKNNKVNDYGFGEAITIVFNSPSVATLSALSFVGESRKAILKGKVTNAGSTGLTQVGVWYSTSSEPYDATSNQGTFIEVSPMPTVNTVYSATIDDGLSGGETYYVRAYATNNNGVTYSFGDPIQLFNPTVATGAVSDQTPTSATVAGTVTGSAEGAEAGVWYSFTGNEYDEDANPGIFKQATIGDGGTISVGLTGLLADQTYYIRAYASNDNKASISFGDAKTHKFSNPKVETVGVSNLPEAGVTVSGKVTENGSLPEDLSGVTAGVWYSTKGGDYNPQMNKGYFVSGPSNPDLNLNTEYSVELPGTGCPAWGSDSTYHARAYLNIGTDESPNYVFGNSIRFSKDNVVLVTGDITNVTGNSATVKGMVESLGQYAIGSVEAGIWWSKEGPTYDASSNAGTFVEKSPYTVGTEYTVELTNLQGYNQYVRAYAKVTVNSGGGSGGDGKEDPTYNYIFGNLATIYTNSPSVSYNTSDYGGGIYMTNSQPNTPTKLVFSGPTEPNPTDHGIINYNYASEAGGGIYIDKSAYMQMKGHCEVNANRVPEGKRGGGIYLDGRLYVGEGKDDAAGTHGLTVNKNYAINATDADFATNYEIYSRMKEGEILEPTSEQTAIFNTYKSALNNVFLTRYESDFVLNWDGDHASHDDDATVITLLSDISGKDSEDKPYTNIGFHVLRGFCPVVATSDAPWGSYVNTSQDSDNSIYESWLYSLMGNNSGSSSGSESSGLDANGALFEDTETYVAIHVRKHTSPPFLPKYIYLWGCWTYPAVNEDPESKQPMVGSEEADPSNDPNWMGHYVITDPDEDGILHWDIYSEEGLSWFSSYVNGLNVFVEGDEGPHLKYDSLVNPYASARIMRDLDMSSHIWTPIGSVTSFEANKIGSTSGDALFHDGTYDDKPQPHHYKGSFDGQGHIIRGVNVRYVTGIYKYGLFGYLDEGASVKNVFVDESNFITDDPNKSYTVGGIAGLVQAYGNNKTIVISGSEARVEIDITNADKTTSYVGGLVGKVEDGTGTIEFPDTTTGSGVVSFDRKPTLIHSSMAMPEVIGAVKYMGGLVGYLGSNDSLVNSFANPLFPEENYADTIRTGENITDHIYIGGLVGENQGLVENCYSRLQGNEPIGIHTHENIFGWFAGTNNATIKHSYALQPSSGTRVYVRNPESPDNTVLEGHGNYGTTALVSGKYGFKHRDQQMFDKDGTTIDDNKYASNNYTVYLKYKTTNDTLIVGGLTNALNAWVKTPVNGWNATTGTNKKGYATWMRSMATIINDDYPVPMFSEFNAVGSEDSVYMHYKHDVNDLLKAYTAIPPTKHPTPAIYLYDTIRNGNEFKAITQTNIGTTNNNVMLAINEDIGILQDVNLRARVGVTFDNSNRSPLPELGGQPYDWHMFSSALNKPSMGLRYHTVDEANADNYHVWKNYANYLNSGIPNEHYNGLVPGYDRTKMDPPKTMWYQSDTEDPEFGTNDPTKIGYFPTNTPYGTWRDQETAEQVGGSFDFYMYGEAYYQHWINFKRRGDATFYDHWRQDPIANGNHLNIPYPNETNMVNGRGYMMGVSQRSMLMADGTLNNGDVTYNATFTVDPSATVYDELVRGTNLIGNPYQSYLDFNLFAVGVKVGETVTAASPNNGNILGNTYYVFDADNMGYIPYTAYASDNPEVSAPRFIHPHQGFFVKIGDLNKDLQFRNNMRVAGNMMSTFRGQNLNYPLVNLLCYNSEGKRDVTTVEINRPDVGGGFKLKGMLNGKMLIYARWDNKDYQTAFTPVGIREVPVRFEVTEDDVFTMRWSTLHGDFHYLHLIDNMTGSDIDMLRATEYHFEGKTTDYKSRFKLVFEVTGLEEEDDNEDDNGSTINFAFRMGDEIVVNGEGYFELFDMQGRRLTAKQLAGSQSSVSLPNVAAGVYLLRLTGDKQVKTQKMVISY